MCIIFFSNLLANKLKLVIHKLISKCQTAFVSNRKLLDGVLVLNEVVDFSKRANRKCILVKVDFEKSYDCVSWDILRSMLRRMGFGDRWYGCMEALVFNSSMFIPVNGSPKEDSRFIEGFGKEILFLPYFFYWW